VVIAWWQSDDIPPPAVVETFRWNASFSKYPKTPHRRVSTASSHDPPAKNCDGHNDRKEQQNRYWIPQIQMHQNLRNITNFEETQFVYETFPL